MAEFGGLSPSRLKWWTLESLALSGHTVIELPSNPAKPLIAAISGQGLANPVILRIYEWNATHGGGSARAADEYRIQLTSAMPIQVDRQSTVILGWSKPFGVFVGWDPEVHANRSTQSPSLQVREETLLAAREAGIAAATRHSGDIVVAFRPELLATYCLNVRELHSDEYGNLVSSINSISVIEIPGLPDEEPDDLTDWAFAPRPKVTRLVESNFRAWDFGYRIAAAYRSTCVVCGIQLSLNEAAHIVPVAWPGSTDLTSNGMSLCRNHHRAYDSSLISVTPDYVVEVSQSRLDILAHRGLSLGADTLLDFHGYQIATIPESLSDRPNPDYLEEGRIARGWVL